MQQIIRYKMPQLGIAFCLILVVGQTLASVTTSTGNNAPLHMGNDKQNLPSALEPVVSPTINQQHNKHQQLFENVAAIAHQMTSAAFNGERNGRSANDDNKYRSETEKKQVMEFLTPKNLFKNIINLFWGSNDEHRRTSKHVIDILAKALELLKNSFNQKARTAGRGLKDTMDEVASAGVSMLHGYVLTQLTDNLECKQQYLCQASKDAVRDGRNLGSLVAQVGGYASSYLLESDDIEANTNLNSALKSGRSGSGDCAKLYPCMHRLSGSKQ